jgi:hypothetical protein
MNMNGNATMTRPRGRLFPAVLVALALLPGVGRAQEAAPPLQEDPRAPRYREVERGFFTGFEVGYLRIFNTRVLDPAKFPLAARSLGSANGLVVGLTAGYDVNRWLAVSLFALGGMERGNVSYGSFDILAAGGDLRLSFVGIPDANKVDRVFFYVHGRAGYVLTYPKGLFGNNDIYLAGGPGVEYFTHLRHFSVGLAADFTYLTKAATAGFAITPTVRYTF